MRMGGGGEYQGCLVTSSSWCQISQRGGVTRGVHSVITVCMGIAHAGGGGACNIAVSRYCDAEYDMKKSWEVGVYDSSCWVYTGWV